VIHYLPCFGDGLFLYLFTESSALAVYFIALPPFLWGMFSMQPASSAGCVLIQFTVCFSDLWCSVVLDGAHWFRRPSL
jgi:hypothetical protein